jgi:hypothetical protein
MLGDEEFSAMAGVASADELTAAVLRTHDRAKTDRAVVEVASRVSSRLSKRSNTAAAMALLCSLSAPTESCGADSDGSPDDDDFAPSWMVEEAVRRSSKQVTGQALTDVRRKLSTMRVADVIDLMAPIDDTPLVTADDFVRPGSGKLNDFARARRRRSSRASSQVLFAPQGVAAATREPAAQRTAKARRGKRAAAMALIAAAPPPPPDEDEDVVAVWGAVEGGPTPPPPPQAPDGAPPPLPVQRALLELTAAEVQQLLVCWGLECFAAQFAVERTDGVALGDIEGLEDLEDFSDANRRQCKKLVRVINAARADGVGLPNTLDLL